jgi:hypothetical protein
MRTSRLGADAYHPGFPEALNGLFQAAKRKTRGYGRFSSIRTVIILIASNPKFPSEVLSSLLRG